MWVQLLGVCQLCELCLASYVSYISDCPTIEIYGSNIYHCVLPIRNSFTTRGRCNTYSVATHTYIQRAPKGFPSQMNWPWQKSFHYEFQYSSKTACSSLTRWQESFLEKPTKSRQESSSLRYERRRQRLTIEQQQQVICVSRYWGGSFDVVKYVAIKVSAESQLARRLFIYPPLFRQPASSSTINQLFICPSIRATELFPRFPNLSIWCPISIKGKLKQRCKRRQILQIYLRCFSKAVLICNL